MTHSRNVVRDLVVGQAMVEEDIESHSQLACSYLNPFLEERHVSYTKLVLFTLLLILSDVGSYERDLWKLHVRNLFYGMSHFHYRL